MMEARMPLFDFPDLDTQLSETKRLPMRFRSLNSSTSRRIFLLSWGLTKDSLYHIGPFIISELVEGVHLFDILKDPAVPVKLYLNPNIDSRMLDVIFEQIADTLLQLL